MTNYEIMLSRHDDETARLLAAQETDPGSPLCGAFIDSNGQTDTRGCGFALAHLAKSFLIPGSRYYHDSAVRAAMERALDFLFAHLRPGGCMDYACCNFASAPDTAFTVNEVISAHGLLERDASPASGWLRMPLLRLIEACCEGICAGGFHTPNHRWAIAACLKHGARICERPDFAARADVYLGEGLDINSDGEFAERSAGNYNQVNDDQMLRLYLATGDRRFLEAARANLSMMLYYVDPDGSVFTNNSTRQDNGRKVYLESYYVLYLLTGYLLQDEALAAFGEYCWRTATAHGQVPGGVEWLALYPQMEGFSRRRTPEVGRVEHYSRLFADSGIGRVRRGDFSCTVMARKPDFLYFQHGANVVSLAIYGNVCEKRNFIPTGIEQTKDGFRVTASVDSWYYLPYDGDGPATSDWWSMDNERTRKKLISDTLSITADISIGDDGAEVTLRAEGLSGVPVRLEWGFLPGCRLRSEHFLMAAAPGGSMTVCHGTLQATDGKGDCVSVGPAFARHADQDRMGGAYPLRADRFTVFFTDYTPFERTVRISADRAFGLGL